MTLPVLPTEIISHIFSFLVIDVLVRRSFGLPDLCACCLVSQSFLGPARAALYRSLDISFDPRKLDSYGRPINERIDIKPGNVREVDRLENDAGDLLRTLVLHPQLDDDVHELRMHYWAGYSNFSAVEDPPLILGTLLRICARLRSLALRGVDGAELRAATTALKACGTKLGTLYVLDGSMEGEWKGEIGDLLRSQGELEHLNFYTHSQSFHLGSPRPEFHLLSLDITYASRAKLSFLLASSYSTLRTLSLLESPASADIDFSLFTSLKNLSIRRPLGSAPRNPLPLSRCTSLRHLTIENRIDTADPPPPRHRPPGLPSFDQSGSIEGDVVCDSPEDGGGGGGSQGVRGEGGGGGVHVVRGGEGCEEEEVRGGVSARRNWIAFVAVALYFLLVLLLILDSYDGFAAAT